MYHSAIYVDVGNQTEDVPLRHIIPSIINGSLTPDLYIDE